ncbi:VOC family protein [Cohnella abietis]|uniref:VOC domain-containing protein n=1 Tax=Cohnella abietis TaxID=2507935 RepID=A0A3T1D5L1_9BACL|nr:VOC family protein [Cohnella abietis]BBI33390.1 hypothetical protein KCTCHS21_27890 [Cohnella abietis]
MKASAIQGSGVRSVSGTMLHVQDLSAMAAWYGEILGVTVKEIASEKPYYEFDMNNGVNLMLDDHRFMQDELQHPQFMLKTLDIDKTYAWVKQNDIPIVLDIQKVHEGLTYFNIFDPEGNVLMIIESDWVNPSPIVPNAANHPITNRIQCIVVPVIDLKRATEWYARLLGHSIKPERQDGGPIYWFDMDNGTGVLLDDNRNHRDWGKFPSFMLNASNINEAYRFMQDKKARILMDIQHEHHFFAADPEGNAIIICL